MKKLTVICQTKIITEYHASIDSATNSLKTIAKNEPVIKSIIETVYKPIEVSSQLEPNFTKNSYILIK